MLKKNYYDELFNDEEYDFLIKEYNDIINNISNEEIADTVNTYNKKL
ncbi:hypothetical protein [Brachyspira sp.]|nr:hypothetical protein [Brachyspira sp.]